LNTAWKILFAQLYDLIILMAVWFITAIPYVLWQGGNFETDPFANLGFQAYIAAITYAYLTYFWTQNGQTPGLRIWKLQLLDEQGYIPSRHRCNIRFLMVLSLFLIGWIGLILGRRQLLQDRFAKTQIVAFKE
jgi:uncharacterized RDD family membrane protein YckC